MQYFLILIALVSSTVLSSQDLGTIKGHITDREMGDAPMMMANITLKGNGSHIQSNLHGNFEIKDVAPGNYILSVSFSGYDNKEIPVAVKPDEVTRINTSLAAKTIDVDIGILLSENAADEEKPFAKERQKGSE